MTLLCAGLLTAQTNQGGKDKQDDPDGKVWGYAFGDYFYKAGGDSTVSALDYTGYKKDFNSLEFRRIYLGYDHNISRDFMARFVLAYDGSDLLASGKRSVIVKDAFLAWKEIFSGSALTIGLQPTPSFSFLSEKVWGYRSVEKTIMDLRGITGSRDMGVMLNGSFDKESKFGYYLMIATGSALRMEINKYKKYYGMLSGSFAEKKITADIYGDYESSGPDRNRGTLSSFLSWSGENITAGAEGFIQKNNTSSTAGFDPFGISVFITGNITKDRFRFFTRYDFFNPDTRTAQYGYNQHFVTAGIDYMPVPKVHIMPNLWLNAYAKKHADSYGRKSDVVPRITFYYDYR